MLRVATGVLGLLMLTDCGARSASQYVAKPRPLPAALNDAIVGSALQGIEWHLNLPAPYCLSFQAAGGGRTEPDNPQLAGLALKHQVLPDRACPPTYSSMIRVVDSLGRDVGRTRPAGYIDPYHLAITPPVAISEERAVVRVEASQGTRGWLLYCEVLIAAPHTATCGPTSHW